MPTPHAPAQRFPVPDPGTHYFTVERANAALPYVQRVVRDITRAYRQIVKLRRALEARRQTALEDRYEQAMDRLGDLVDELHLVGVELRDFEKGLLDFPAWYDGREVMLCWRLGEDRIGYYHEVEAGSAGRQPVEQLMMHEA